MREAPSKKTIRRIVVNADKCSGCGLCESVCSAFHAETAYGRINPKRARIRVFRDEENALFVPILAGPYTDAECNGRMQITVRGKTYGDCSFCRASCPSRDLFKEPDATDIPLKCDMCGEPPRPDGPSCVEVCFTGALTYTESIEEDSD